MDKVKIIGIPDSFWTEHQETVILSKKNATDFKKFLSWRLTGQAAQTS